MGLPKFDNKFAIIVLIDHLSKYAHFYALQHPFKDSIVVQFFMDNMFKLHGMYNLFSSNVTPPSLTISRKSCFESREIN